ncbi:hypothetical protein Pla175_35870 [Pirellulimonas nuda]|uniref:Glycosyl transferases group 1 n=1 Tax=Pirellulimonas nuda TaxID=2528009 RepID=A0A518DFC9_9BACT|nr:glycosyltransferase family 4 protein [Pirellulimonas nuda]QDU90185.1 hypothetical protein Pla175_35870 [Pirellulimonas nuda]
MQLAIAHYHLDSGGVTQVIRNQLRALAACPAASRPERVVVLYGGRRGGWPAPQPDETPPFELELVPVAELEYSESASARPDAMADRLHQVLGDHGMKVDQTLIHFHNHSLGKNGSVPGALALLADRGYRLLLQVHDFIEDFRPANYRRLERSLGLRDPQAIARVQYPQNPSIHYATLTTRDSDLLLQAGVAAERVHLLPNPVVDFHKAPPRDEARARVAQRLGLKQGQRLLVYPVRGIRRKNLGEMLLHAALDGGQTMAALTLPPISPVELPSYDRWHGLSERLRLPCRFDIGGLGRLEYEDSLAASDALLTTSVAEGFGLVFLEAWLAGRPLTGRNLPEITGDFETLGMRFDLLDPDIKLPVDWLPIDEVREAIGELHEWVCRDYGFATDGAPLADERQAQLAAIGAEGTIDFAQLPTHWQADVVTRIRQEGASAIDRVLELNPTVAAGLKATAQSHRETIESNAAVVRQHYSPQSIGGKLCATYAAVQEAPAGPCAADQGVVDGAVILRHYLRADRLHPVRTEA